MSDPEAGGAPTPRSAGFQPASLARRPAYWCMVKVDFSDPVKESEFNEWYNEVHKVLLAAE